MGRNVCNHADVVEATVAEAGMTGIRVLIAIIAAALSSVAVASAQTPRALIELFTSQGCSSCPPADTLLAELRKDASLVTLSLPIDYWDYLGWKDTLALPNHTARQKAYAQMRRDREVYTPQVVVNGVVQALGSDRIEIENALQRSRQKTATPSLPVTVSVTDDRISVTLPDTSREVRPSEVWLCPLTRSVRVAVGRGENRGRDLTYTNVVRRWVKLGTWSGRSEAFTVPLDAIMTNDIDSIAVIVQSGTSAKPGAIIGASYASLR
jgi:hypothetical protein